MTEYNIVRGFKRVAAWTGEPMTVEIEPAELPEGGAQAALLQHPGHGPILAAAVLAGAAE